MICLAIAHVRGVLLGFHDKKPDERGERLCPNYAP
jgi:hypothetical protein